MLLLEELIIDSDGDMEIGSVVVAGFDDDKNLVVELHFSDYVSDYDRKTWAVVEKEDALEMAKHLEIRLTALPAEIGKRFGDSSDTAVPSEVEGVFKDILDFILECGVHYRLKKDL